MLRNLTLGTFGALMIGLSASAVAAQGNGCQPGTISQGGKCVASVQQQAQPQGTKAKAPDQPEARAQGKGEPAQKSQSAQTASKKSDDGQNARFRTGERLSGGQKVKDPKAHGLTPSTHYSYVKADDGQVYRVDNDTQKIIAVIGAIAALVD